MKRSSPVALDRALVHGIAGFVFALGLGLGGSAAAQLAPTLALTAEARADPAVESLRLTHREARRIEGGLLLAFGALSAGAGATLLGFPGETDATREARLAAAVTTISFGVINAALALGFFDLSGRERRQAQDHRLGLRVFGPALRGHLARRERRSARAFAINFALDLVYLAAGATLTLVGARARSDLPWARGAGTAMIVQGAGLLAFDVFAWIRAAARARSYESEPG